MQSGSRAARRLDASPIARSFRSFTSTWVGGVEGGVQAAALSVHLVTAARTVSRERHMAGSLGGPTLAQVQSQNGVFGLRLFASAEAWRFGMVFPRNLRGGVLCTGLDGQAVQALQSVARGVLYSLHDVQGIGR